MIKLLKYMPDQEIEANLAEPLIIKHKPKLEKIFEIPYNSIVLQKKKGDSIKKSKLIGEESDDQERCEKE